MSGLKDTAKKITGSPFFTFSRVPLEFIEKAKFFKIFFSLVCIVMAVITLVRPFIILFQVASSGYFNFGVKYILAFIFVWLAVVAACWLGFHLWLERQKKAEELGSSEFIMLPFFSEILKTFGEWLAILFCVIGFVGGLFALIFLGKNGGAMLSTVLFGVKMPSIPLLGGLHGNSNGAIIIGPVVGIAIMFVSRFFAETLKVLATIANNTKK